MATRSTAMDRVAMANGVLVTEQTADGAARMVQRCVAVCAREVGWRRPTEWADSLNSIFAFARALSAPSAPNAIFGAECAQCAIYGLVWLSRSTHGTAAVSAQRYPAAALE